MKPSCWTSSFLPGTRRHRLFGVVLALLTIAQASVMLASSDEAEATTSNRTRLSTGVPDAVAPELAAEGRTLHSVWADSGLAGAPARGVGYRRSEDGGTTWSSIRQLDLHEGKGHSEWPRVAVDGETVVVTWSETTTKDTPDAGNRQIWATVSTDGGQSFGYPFRLDSDRADSQRPLVVVRGTDIWIAWGDLSGDVYISTSHDQGDTFELDQLVDGWGAPLGRDAVAVDGDTVAVAWMHDEGERNKDVDVRVSQDGGDTWAETIAIADTPDYVFDWTPAVTAADGVVHVAWAGDGHTLVRRSPDRGISFEPATDLGEGGVASMVARRGLVAIASGDPGGVRIHTSPGDGTWSQSLVAGPSGGSIPDLAVRPDSTDDGPRAAFTWSMPERFGMDKDGDGLVDEREDSGYVRPPFFKVRFDGCASNSGGEGEITYAWTIDDVPFGPNACSFEHEFTEEADHTVGLEVTQAGGEKATATHTVEVDDLFIVSLGDSVASGEGNPDVPGSGIWPWSEDSVWQNRQCNRSAKSGPSLAAAEIERSDPLHSVTFVHLACSGASVYGPDIEHGGLLSPYEGINPSEGDLLAPQLARLEQIAGGREVDAVFLSIGANDLHFSGVVKDCLTLPGCYDDFWDTEAVFDARLAELPEHYLHLADQLEELGIEDVYITEYFDPTVDETGAWNLSCTANLGQDGISDTESRWASLHVMGYLNGAVRAAADTYGWHYVGGIADKFLRHGYCAEDPYVVQLGESYDDQADKNGAFHPNNVGHEVYGQRIADDFLASQQPAVEAPGTPDPTTEEWAGDLYLAWGNGNVKVTTLRSDGGQAEPVRTVDVSQSTGTLGTRFTSLAASEHGASVAWDESDAIDPSSYTGHWHAYAAPAVQAPPDLALDSASLTQAPDGADFLVAGKQTAVHAEIVSTLRSSQTVDVRFEVRDELGAVVTSDTQPVAIKPGHNDVYLEGSPESLVPTDGEWWVDVQVDPDGDVNESDEENNHAATEEYSVRTSRQLRTLYVPVGGTSCATATGLAASSSPWLHAVMPVADGGLTQHSDCGYAMPGSNGSDEGIAHTLSTLDGMSLLSGYDTAVGVVPSGWLQSATGGAVGLGLYGDSAPAGAPAGGILVEQGQGPSVIAHEIGHNFGLEHTGEESAPGYWVAGGTEQDGIDLMDSVAQTKPWIGSQTWTTLMERFQLTAEQSEVVLGLAAGTSSTEDGSLVVRGTIAPDGTAEIPAWYETDEAPDVALGSTADLVLEYRGAGDALLDTAGIHVSSLEPLGGSGLEGWASFGARVPLIDGVERLVLRQGPGGPILADRNVTDSAPDVSLLSPTASTWAAIGGELDVRWTASDPDGTPDADLRSALSYSTDGGVTFKPIAIDIEGTQTTWAIGDHLAGKPVQIRLDVTDGVRTTSVVSETLTVGGTPPAGQPRLAVVRNVEEDHGWGPYDSQLYTMNPDGIDLQHVPTVGSVVLDPRWSPDGQHIAFTTDGPEDEYVTELDVYSVRPDGSDLVNLTPGPVGQGGDWRFRCAQWHPDGSKVLVHVSQRDNYTISDLAWAAADGSGLTTVASDVPFEGPNTGCPALSRDGSRVAFWTTSGIQVLDLASGTRSLVLPTPAGGGAQAPFWTPDGGSIIASVSTGTSLTPKNYWGLMKLPADGSAPPTPLLDLNGLMDPFNAGRVMPLVWPRFTPDGNQILFTGAGMANGPDTWRYRLLCTINGDATGLSCLQDVPLSDFGGGFLEGDLAPGGSATPPPPPPWSDPAPVVEPPVTDPAHAGGPYTAVEDEPVHLDAGASALAAGEVPLAEWDLDHDGEFDDAVGLHTIGVIQDAGERPVRVRITTADGETAEASTTAAVSRTAPAVLAPAPFTVIAGRSYSLAGASFQDPGTDGHTAIASWGDGSTGPLGARPGEGGLLEGHHTWAEPGSYPVDITVCDEGTDVCATSTTTVTVVAGSGGSAPVAEDVEVRTPRGTPVRIALPATDADGDELDRSIVTDPAHGAVVEVEGDVVEYRPDGGFEGVDSFTWAADDGKGLSEPVTATIIVGNTAPIAGDDEVEIEAGTERLIDTAALLGNDSDPDEDDLTVAGAYAGAGMAGELERTDEGVRFTAPEGFEGSTTFEYAVSDGNGGLDLATVTVVVVAGTDPTPTTPTTEAPTPTTTTTDNPAGEPGPTVPPTTEDGPTTTVASGDPDGSPTTDGAVAGEHGAADVAGAVTTQGTLPVTGTPVLPQVVFALALILIGAFAVRSGRWARNRR